MRTDFENHQPTDFTRNNPSNATKRLKGKTTSKPYSRNNRWHKTGELYDCSDTEMQRFIFNHRFRCMTCGVIVNWYNYPFGENLPDWFKQ